MSVSPSRRGVSARLSTTGPRPAGVLTRRYTPTLRPIRCRATPLHPPRAAAVGQSPVRAPPLRRWVSRVAGRRQVSPSERFAVRGWVTVGHKVVYPTRLVSLGVLGNAAGSEATCFFCV